MQFPGQLNSSVDEGQVMTDLFILFYFENKRNFYYSTFLTIGLLI